MVSWQTVQVVSLMSGVVGMLKTVDAAFICSRDGLTITFSILFKKVVPRGIVCRGGLLARLRREVSIFVESISSESIGG